MNSQQLIEEIYETYEEHLERDEDGTVLNRILIGLLLREREKNEVLSSELRRRKMAGVG